MKDDGRMVKNRVARKLGNDERLFKEKRVNLKYKNLNRFYTIHEGITRENQIQILTNPIFYANHRQGDASLFTISIIHLILPPQ